MINDEWQTEQTMRWKSPNTGMSESIHLDQTNVRGKTIDHSASATDKKLSQKETVSRTIDTMNMLRDSGGELVLTGDDEDVTRITDEQAKNFYFD